MTNKKGVIVSAKVDASASRFDHRVCLSGEPCHHVTSSNVWFVDNGASCHMTGVGEHFTSLTEDDIDLEVVLGDNSKVRAIGVGTISFQWESSLSLKVTYGLYVPGLKNLILVSNIEGRRYEVVFQGGQVLIYPKGSGIEFARMVGVCNGRLQGYASVY